MKRIFTFIIVLCLVLTGMLTIIPMKEIDDDKMNCSGTRATLVVGSGQAYSTVTAAIAAANPGDIIRVYDGTYNEKFTVDKTLTIIGNGSTSTIINGDNSIAPIHITANWVNVSKLKVQNGWLTSPAGGIYMASENSTVSDCNVTSNYRGFTIWSYNNTVRN